VLTYDDVLVAAGRIGGRVRCTPLLAPADGERWWFKCEHLQTTGVFKVRGAYNHQLAALERGDLDPGIGIVAASGGNAGLAHAHAAAALGMPATVYLPSSAPPVKVARIRSACAQVRQVGAAYAEAYAEAVTYAEQVGALFCHAYDQVEVAAGAGTIALEILADEPGIGTIVVSVGGGGLYAGIAAAAAGRARIVAVEPERCPTLHAALAAGAPVDVAVSGVAVDSLGARRIGQIAWQVASATPPRSVLVEDRQIITAREWMWQNYRIACEHGAATAVAALLSGAYVPEPGERVAIVVCGANTDPTTITVSSE